MTRLTSPENLPARKMGAIPIALLLLRARQPGKSGDLDGFCNLWQIGHLCCQALACENFGDNLHGLAQIWQCCHWLLQQCAFCQRDYVRSPPLPAHPTPLDAIGKTSTSVRPLDGLLIGFILADIYCLQSAERRESEVRHVSTHLPESPLSSTQFPAFLSSHQASAPSALWCPG